MMELKNRVGKAVKLNRILNSLDIVGNDQEMMIRYNGANFNEKFFKLVKSKSPVEILNHILSERAFKAVENLSNHTDIEWMNSPKSKSGEKEVEDEPEALHCLKLPLRKRAVSSDGFSASLIFWNESFYTIVRLLEVFSAEASSKVDDLLLSRDSFLHELLLPQNMDKVISANPNLIRLSVFDHVNFSQIPHEKLQKMFFDPKVSSKDTNVLTRLLLVLYSYDKEILESISKQELKNAIENNGVSFKTEKAFQEAYDESIKRLGIRINSKSGRKSNSQHIRKIITSKK